MALGLGEGGEQTPRFGRAVIGGLLVATCFHLVVVRCVQHPCAVAPPAPPIVIQRDTHEAPHQRSSIRLTPEGQSATRPHLAATPGLKWLAGGIAGGVLAAIC